VAPGEWDHKSERIQRLKKDEKSFENGKRATSKMPYERDTKRV
jgi:hypothetical protein